MIKQLRGFRCQREKAKLVAFAVNAKLGFGKQHILRIQGQHFGGPESMQEHQTHDGQVNPGDSIWCSVQYVNNQTAGLIYFANETTGQNFSLTLAPPPAASFDGNSAEWIMEAPSGGLPNSSLPSFTPVQFTNAFSCTANQVTGDPQNGDILEIAPPPSPGNPSPPALTFVTVGSGTVTIDFKG